MHLSAEVAGEAGEPATPVVISAESKADPHESSALVAFACYVMCCLAFIVAVSLTSNFWDASRHHGDNQAYLTIAQAAAEGRFSGPDLDSLRNFYRGTGYAVALASMLTTVPVARCLPILTLACGAIAMYLCGRLWGWRIASLFAFIDIAYTQRVCLGGCESIFVALVFASLWAWRKERTLSAMAWATLALWTRPTGLLLLVALGAVLLWHRRWRDILRSAAVVGTLGAIYLAPLVMAAKDPLAPVNGYADDWYSASPITLPFYPLLREALSGGAPWSNHLKNGFYIALTVFGVVTLWRRRRTAFTGLASQVESSFFLLFAGFCVSYNSFGAYVDYPRYSAPIVPQSLLGIRARRLASWVIFPISAAAGLVSAASAMNVRNLFHMLTR
jgi:hypothetical protein